MYLFKTNVGVLAPTSTARIALVQFIVTRSTSDNVRTDRRVYRTWRTIVRYGSNVCRRNRLRQKKGHTRTKQRLVRASDSTARTRLVRRNSTHLTSLGVFVYCSTKRPKTVMETPRHTKSMDVKRRRNEITTIIFVETVLRQPDNYKSLTKSEFSQKHKKNEIRHKRMRHRGVPDSFPRNVR